MGVTGLWRLVEPAGRPVPVETLENKVLAVDISIWLHQMVKGYQDAKGAPLPNAHLMGLFQRLCKLLYFRIKPVFVFDGGFPDLKRETIAKRQDHKQKYNSESERLKRELALLLSKKTAINTLLGKQLSPTKGSSFESHNDDDLFKLPALPQNEDENASESDEDQDTSSGSVVDLHSVDIESESFKNLPVKEKYDLLVELKETRKMNSWGKLHELPKKSDNFSDFQMQRLLKRRKVQECLEDTEKEMGDASMSINDLESLLNEEGIDTKISNLPTRRIASNDTTRYLLINDVKETIANLKKAKISLENKPSTSKNDALSNKSELMVKRDELEDDLQKAIQMSLECVDEINTSANTTKTDESWTSFLTDSDSGTDSEEEDGFEQPDISSAKAYIMQYSDFTHDAIDGIVNKKTTSKNKAKVPKVVNIMNELNNERSVIVDRIDLSSDEECIPNEVESINKKINDTKSQIDLIQSDDNFNGNINYEDQLSVVYVENTVQNIILDTSTDDDIKIHEKKQLQARRDTSDPDSNHDDFEEVPQQESKKKKLLKVTSADSNHDDFEEVLQQESKGKKQLQDTKDTTDSDSSHDDFEEVPQESKKKKLLKVTSADSDHDDFEEVPQQESKGKKQLQDTKDTTDSDSNHDDFEEVSQQESTVSKPIVQLMFNINDVSEDDIFADIFTDKIKHDSETATDELKKECHDMTIEKSKMQSYHEVKELNKQSSEVDGIKPSLDHLNHNENCHSRTEKSENNKVVVNIEESKKTKEITMEKLNKIAEGMQNKENSLLQEKCRLERIGRNITEQMTKEAQELLQIFGIPYIVAPMEAEAQCAFLESVNLTDGTITDDSDIWLFGGKTVYKNFFNQKKHVLQFLSKRIEKSFNLTREQLVLLALLVGSDYTTGVLGVGPVTALEILASFPFNKRKVFTENSQHARYDEIVAGLEEFKKWVKAGRRTDNINLKKKLKNVNISDDFPSIRVVKAYLEPNVEKSEDKFTWGEIDITILRDYTRSKFGWSQNKLDEIINPVLKRITERKTQKTVHDFFNRTIEFQSLEDQMSKRVKAAVQKMAPEGMLEHDVFRHQENKTKENKRVKKDSDEILLAKPGPSKSKRKKVDEKSVLKDQGVKIVTEKNTEGKSCIQINITKTDRYQEVIPQREKDKQSLLQNKLKAIETFRKTKIDRKTKTKKRHILPKEKAELSESSDSN